MNCPACGNRMTVMAAGGVAVEICAFGCGGMWFDRFELDKVDHPHEHAGEKLLSVGTRAGLEVDLTAKRTCPNCGDAVMRQCVFSARRRVTVEECPRCGGVWVDAGDLRVIRTRFDSPARRGRAAGAYFKDVFDNPPSAPRDEDREALSRRRRFARMFSFLSPAGCQTNGDKTDDRV